MEGKYEIEFINMVFLPLSHHLVTPRPRFSRSYFVAGLQIH